MPFLCDARAPDGLRLYAIGDIHGRIDLLRETHARIAADLLDRPCRAFRVIHLGDLVDRGPDSAGVVEHLIEFCRDGDAACLAGNHELFVLRFLHKPQSVGEQWLDNGGEEMLESYGLKLSALKSLKQVRKGLEEAMPASHRAFFEALPLCERHGDYLFVHAGLRPGIPLARQTEADLTGIREPFLSSRADHGFVVVHGHTPSASPVVRPNRVGIDTKAFASGRLTCLALEGADKGFLTPEGYEPLPAAA
jgi:serine/threonine protein phosphatase 1